MTDESIRYYLCPECSGASAEEYEGEPCNDACPRCGRRGTLREDEMVSSEIEDDERFWEEDSEARNRVDF